MSRLSVEKNVASNDGVFASLVISDRLPKGLPVGFSGPSHPSLCFQCLLFLVGEQWS